MPPPTTVRTAVVLGVSAAMLLLGGLLFAPPSPVGLSRTSVLNVLFDNRWVVGATRLVAAITLWFLVASMVARATQGQWVRRAGTVDVGDEVVAISEDQEVLQQRLVSAYETIEHLRQELAETLVLLESVSDTEDTAAPRAVKAMEAPVANSEQRALLARRVQESRATLERADREAEEIQRALQRSREVRERTVPALRRAGLLR